MSLSVQQQILIEQRVTNEAKSTGVAYLLWFFFWYLGAHRFYLGQTVSAIAMLALTIVGALTVVIGVGIVLMAAVAIWAFVDLFLIPGMVQAQKDKVRQSLMTTAMLANGAAQGS